VSIVPREPSKSSTVFNSIRDVPVTRDMIHFWSMLRPIIPDSVARSRNTEIVDLNIKSNTTARITDAASGAQPTLITSTDAVTMK